VRVNGVLWHEADHPAGLGPSDREYVTRTDDEDKTTVTFGNGEYGARLPTGVENVTALYRTGIGRPGNVGAERISLLATRPLGVKSVINPQRASGGADREGPYQARGNAPLGVKVLDRLVSVQDYADYARTFAGIGKASAVQLSDGRRAVIHLTIAGADDIPIDQGSDLYANLRASLRRFGDPHQPFVIAVRELMLVFVSARVRLHPDYLWELVAPQIRDKLLETYSFERRELGQDVVLSRVIRTIQGVAGVVYVDVDLLDSVDEHVTPAQLTQLASTLALKQRIPVEMARRDAQAPRGIRPAQLAYLSPDVPNTLILTELT
jgi:predicted phage baseplate assembly protein